MPASIAYLLVSISVLTNVYAQLILKWRTVCAGAFPLETAARVEFFWGLAKDPWVFSAYLALFFASLTWIAALVSLPLSHTYPFLSASFALVVVCGSIIFGEPLGPARIAGLVFIMAGIFLSR